MGSIYRRKGTRFVWIKWRDHLGQEHQQSAETEDEAVARAVLDEIERQERIRTPITGSLTVDSFFEDEWLPHRRRLKPDAWQTDASRLRHHFLPHFGARELAALATDAGEVELLDWVIGLREHRAKRDGTPLGARTIWNIASIVRVFFADALERKRIRRNPTLAWNAEKHLPPKTDKVPGWRGRAGFSLEQVVTLTTDPRIPEDRRVLYGVRFLGGGLRPGEAANARWRDLDASRRPLARLTLVSAFNSLTRREKATKTGAELNIPVHPVLAKLLEAWHAEGWAQFIGRAPGPDDLIIPRQDGTQRRVNVSLEQFHADLAAVGFARQRQYESRSTFRNLVLARNAPEFQVNLITHPSPKRASDFYTRLEMQWGAMCDAVAVIPASAWDGTPLALSPPQVQSAGTVPAPGKKKPRQPDEVGGVQVVTRTGFEPMFSA